MHVDSPAATLEFLLVSSDSSTVSSVQTALTMIGGVVACGAPSADAARELITTRKVDGVILDVDIKNALDLISRMRRSKNARAFAFVCVTNDAEEAVVLKGGANAILTRPLSVQAVSAQVGSFRSIIASERRRYQRHDVTLPAVITHGDIAYPGIVENISQGGMAIRLPCLLPGCSPVEFSFDLESGITVEGSAQLRWANQDGLTGMEFSIIPSQSKDALMAWLRELSSIPFVSD